MPYIDTHAHLDDQQFDDDRDEVIRRAQRSGIEAVVCPAITADSSQAVLRLAEAHQAVYAAVGIQPNYCAQAAAGDWDRVVALVDHPRVVGVGETGLDRHWDFTPMEAQQDYFDRHLRLAARHGLPVVIHCREAEAELLPMLREAAARGPLRGVLHAFSGDQSTARECLELGLYVSFAGAVTYKNRKFDPLRAAAMAGTDGPTDHRRDGGVWHPRMPPIVGGVSHPQIPPTAAGGARWCPLVADDRILIETDSPYLVPHPLRGKQKRNEPANLLHTAEYLAKLRGQSLKAFAAQTTANARRLFRLQ